MKNLALQKAPELIICLAVFLLSLLVFVPVTDDYAYFMCSLAAKQFSNFSYSDVHYQGFIGIREVYRLLYYLFPIINWHFVYHMAYVLVCLYLLLRALKTIVLKNISNRYLTIAIQLLAALAYTENISSVSHTRVSLLFCGIALFNMAFTQTINRKGFLVYSAVFIFGMLLRPESSMGTLLLIGAGYLIYSFNVIALIKRIWLPITATLVFILIFTIDLNHTDIYVRQVEPEIEYKLMARRIVNISEMKTAKDLVKYKAALIGMWFDTKEMTPAFLRSILLPGADLSFGHAREVFIHVLGFYQYYNFIPFIIAGLLLLAWLLLPDYLLRIFRISGMALITFAITFLLDYNGLLVCNRHFLNLQFISLLIIVFYFFNAAHFGKPRYQTVLITIVLCFLFCQVALTNLKYKQENMREDQQLTSMMNSMQEFERRYTNRIVAITLDSRFCFDQHFFVTNKMYNKNTYLMFDWFTFSLTPRYVNYVSNTCHCQANNPVAFFDWLRAYNGLYLATPYRYHLTEQYMKTIHHYPVKFGSPVRFNSLIGIDNKDTEDCEIRTVSLATD